MHYGHIQLFRDDQGWQASVYHYEPKRLTHDGRVIDDPVAALRAALIEDERRSRDLERRYAGSVKLGDAERAQKVRDAVTALSGSDEFEGMFS
jgi:hypothetical protein